MSLADLRLPAAAACCCWLAPLLAQEPVRAPELVPAGTINGALNVRDSVIIAQDEPGIARYAGAIQRKFFAACRRITDAQAVQEDLQGKALVVYGTPANAWLAAHAERLPFRFDRDTLTIDGHAFTGEHLRVI